MTLLKITEIERRRQRTQEFLDELGVKMPIIKFSTPTKEADLIHNKNFIKIITELLFDKIDEELKDDEIISLREMKLHTTVFKHSYKKKFVYSEWTKTKLPSVINSIYPEVINTLQDTLIVDFIDEEGDRWLDIDYPLYYTCLEKYFIDCLKYSDDELDPIEKGCNL